MDDEFLDNSTSSRSSASSEEQPVPGRRGRGRPGRGRVGGRQTRRGRRGGRAFPAPVPNRAEIAAEARAERDRQMQERINNLSLEDMRTTMLTAYREQPSFIFRVLDIGSQHGGAYLDPPAEPQRDQPTWCRCGRCREMPTDVEKRCCNQIPQNCHSQLPDFHNVVLDPLVLEVAMRYRNDMLAQPVDQDYNRCHRHAAYRQYILWIHGYLGAGNRQVIPSCCVWGIRDHYPDPSGQYIGFIGGRFQ